ncbi:uncharacterized protein ARMOST_13463 [Armillaria ostoyae]|uniref:Uncharacterized protein n=1 Tax=Armillaria ostoyae TaxID=47428 RepID=A0A284RMX7_ARMOS|nr:uncharacterized protein ARMOST_13463 [Armillaria ostoyae]
MHSGDITRARNPQTQNTRPCTLQLPPKFKRINEITNILVLEFERNLGPETLGYSALRSSKDISDPRNLAPRCRRTRTTSAEQNQGGMQDDSGIIDTDLGLLAMKNQQVERIAGQSNLAI